MPVFGRRVHAVMEKHHAALLMLLGFGSLSVMLALLHNVVRARVFHDNESVDVAFDAGGKVSFSLTAVTVMSQLLWPGDLLQSSTVAVRNGVSGAFWYSVGAVVNMILFPVFSVYFKTRAPGAHTFLQVISARFGPPAHIVYAFFALLTNVVVTSTLIVAGHAILASLVRDVSDEFIVLVLVTLFGCYAMIGGLGSTFYVSYVNAFIVFICLLVFIINLFYVETELEGTPMTLDIDSVYESLACLVGPNTNLHSSYLTFQSQGAVVWGLTGIFVTSSLTFCDQASWQSRIAAKPVQGVLGFLAASFMWFAVPAAIGPSTGLAYLALSASNRSLALSDHDINAGLVTPYVAEKVLGPSGGVMLLVMMTMSLMSTGSGEVMAISSIFIYDIFQKYIRPFRRGLESGECVLCGARRADHEEEAVRPTALCKCPPVSECSHCKTDNSPQQASTSILSRRHYTCPVHGAFREYQDDLARIKSWCVLWVTVGVLPLGLIVLAAKIDLNWAMLVGFTVCIPGFPGVLLSVVWVKASTAGVISGAVGGLTAGVTALLVVASTYEGGLGNFLVNTAQVYSVLAGGITTLVVTVIVTVVVSLFTHKIKSEGDEEREWEKLREIDNPLRPWAQTYVEEFGEIETTVSDVKVMQPTFKQLDATFRKAKVVAYIGGVCSALLFVVVIPVVMVALQVLSSPQFRTWMLTMQIWCFLTAAIVIVLTPIEEVISIVRQLRKRSPDAGTLSSLEASSTCDGSSRIETQL
nr:DUR3-like urea transporter subtype A3 [Theodoxus fluviatilis]